MEQNQSLNHSKWECKHHAVSIPKCHRWTLYAQLDLVDGRRLAEALLREPLTEVRLDEVDVFLCQGHDGGSING